jgi:hypothetical protein
MSDTPPSSDPIVAAEGGFLHTITSIDFLGLATSALNMAISLLLALLPWVEFVLPYVLPLFLAYSLFKIGKDLYAWAMSQ